MPHTDSPEVLVVDDVPANLVAMRALLDDLNVSCHTAESGTHALRKLLTQDYAVVLLDVHMPELDGFETAKLIRSRPRSADLPIVFITARGPDSAHVARGYALGAADFLYKPVLPDVLRAKLMTFIMLDRARRRAEDQAREIAALEREAAARRLVAARERWEKERLSVENQRKDEFLAMLAHELRNPLAPLGAGITLMQTSAAPVHRDVLARMERQVSHLTRFVDDLLDVARLSSGKIHLERRTLLLCDAVEHATTGMEAAFSERGQSLEVRLHRGIHVHADDVRLVQIVSNLLSNASRYTEPDGHIWVQTGVRGPEAYVRVQDDGRGIEPEMIDTIFETFIQERDTGEGLGLGLALVRRLAQLHQGRVEVESGGRGHGSTFTVWLPVAEPPAPEDRTPPPASPVDDPVGKQVLVVDDNEDVRMLTSMLIQSWGLGVLQAESGPRGVELALEHRPDVAIIDISMPGMSGYEVARALARDLGDAAPRMIAVTGYSDADTRARIEASPFTSYLVKPADPDRLRDALEGTT